MYLHDLLTVQAAENPAGTAASYDDLSVSFEEVERRASLVALSLAESGVRAGTPVGLHMSRSLDLLPAIFGVLRSGAVCVPVDPEDPPDRRATILSSSGTTHVLTERALSAAVHPAGAQVISIEDALAREQGTQGPPAGLAGNSLAFIFYTSGSSGTPKGVMLTHRALLSGQRWLQRTFPLAPGDRQLLRTTLSITNLVREVFWPMLSGSTAVIVPPGGHKDPDQMAELIRQAGVSTLMVVPALLSSMLENPAFASSTSLKYVFCSSDVMPGSLPAKYFATGLPARLFNVYGLTEALYISCWECLPGSVYEGFVPVGYPAELEPRVLDADMRQVPDGEPGELCVGGVGIAEGYHRLPELTAERFASTPQGRVFRTGDMARTADGRIDLLGRMDDQIKIAGYRVELGEVEARLQELPGIVGAVASGRREAGGHQRLIAHLSCEGELPTTGAIRASLAGRLPEYMIPSAYLLVDDIPLTHNGKVDRRALLDIVGVPLPQAEDHVAARNETEAYLCGLWADTLSAPQVGVHDNFFALGGDSIQGFLISARANRDGIGLGAAQVFVTPTVAETAAYIERKGIAEAGQASHAPRVSAAVADEQLAAVRRSSADPGAVETAYPLTQMQKGMLFHSLLDPASGVYLEQFLYSVSGDLDADAYHMAWQQVIGRHEILRAWIATRGLDEPMQVVQRTAKLEWTTLDWTDYDHARQNVLLGKHLDDDRRRGFGYGHPPLFRLCLIRLGPAAFKLVMSYHHLILDAWSLFVLLRDSLEIYHAQREDRPPQLEAPGSFRDYVAFLEHEDATAARDYWRDRLAGLNRPTVIGESARLGLSASSRDMHAEGRLDLGEELTARLLSYGRASQLTLNSLVQGAWAMVVAGLSGQEDVCFGITITHRPVGLANVENIVGIFINTLPMRVQVDRSQPIGRWLNKVQLTQVAARSHDHYPLPLIQQRTDLPGGQPLFESLLIFENFPRGSTWTGRGGVQVEQERYIGWTNYPFAIEAMPGDNLFFQVKYDLAFFSPESVDRILAAFRDVLASIADGGKESVGKIIAHIVPSQPTAQAGQSAEAGFPARSSARQETVATAPSTDDEAALARVWATVLGLDQVDVRVPFLAAGGSSLAGMSLVNLAQEAGFDIALGDLFTADGTVEHLASREHQSLVTIRASGSERMVLVHPVGGHLLGYRDLIDALPGRFAVYGLQSPPADRIPDSLADLADLHTQALSAVAGPIHLLGWSMGGVLAAEIARRLMAAGAAPSSLTLVDTFVSAADGAELDEATVAAGFLGEYLGQPGPTITADAAPPGEPDPLGHLAARHLPGHSVPALRESCDQYRALYRLLLAHPPRRIPRLASTLVVTAANQPADAFPGLLPIHQHPGELVPGYAASAALPETHYTVVQAAAAQGIVRLLPGGIHDDAAL